ncbi:hypothetical protein F5884DRAFT_674371 [Xylogone sp. PMI_703]|nr:hypothetical protein F5884DRAFT_674371 [Xylogone sp. PMI_703]
MPIARRFSVTNFFIATTALAFQVFVLYPWHQQLDEDFEKLKKHNLQVLEMGEKRLGQIQAAILALEKQKAAK